MNVELQIAKAYENNKQMRNSLSSGTSASLAHIHTCVQNNECNKWVHSPLEWNMYVHLYLDLVTVYREITVSNCAISAAFPKLEICILPLSLSIPVPFTAKMRKHGNDWKLSWQNYCNVTAFVISFFSNRNRGLLSCQRSK